MIEVTLGFAVEMMVWGFIIITATILVKAALKKIAKSNKTTYEGKDVTGLIDLRNPKEVKKDLLKTGSTLPPEIQKVEQ